MIKYLYISLPLLLLVLVSCEKLFMQPEPSDSVTDTFDEVWNFADREYSFFEYKQINWDSVYQEFRPRVVDGMNLLDFFAVLDDMLFVLRDGHVNLSSYFDRSRNWEWYLNSPENFNYSILERNYFNGEQELVGPFTAMDFGDVGYFRYPSFSSTVGNRSIDFMIARFWNKKGIIIDMRNNGGGSLSNVDRIASRFTQKELVVGKQRFKNGPGHGDFTDFQDMTLEPDGQRQFTKPVIVLTNRKSYSATNTFTLYMKAISHVTIMGDTTGGGGGAPANTQLTNGWILRVSATQVFTEDGFNVEGGIPPDVQVDLRPEDEEAGVDTILEEALKALR